MIRRSWVFALVLGSIGCGTEAIEPATLGEVCGVQGPFRLLALTPDERVGIGPLAVGDRYVYTRLTARGTGKAREYVDPEAWSVGTCGESPRRLAEDVGRIWVDPRWPDVVFGCRMQANDVVTLDPAGVSPPQVVFPDVGCFPRETSWGVVQVVGEDPEDQTSPATVSLLPYPDDPRTATAEPVVLLDPVAHPEYSITNYALLRVLPDEILALTDDATLLRISLPDGATSVEMTGVRGFTASPDGRYLLYQAATNDDAPGSAPVFILDRTTGEGLSLGTSDRYLFALRRYEDGLIVLPLSGRSSRVYFLPGLDFVDLPPGIDLAAKLDDGRWLMRDPQAGGPIYLGDLHDLAAVTTLFGGGTPLAVQPDGMLVLDAPPCCWNEGSQEVEGGLWFVPFDGAAPYLVADRASYHQRFVDDQRLVTAVKTGEDDDVAALLLLDLDAGTEQLIDQHALISDPAYAVGTIADGVLRYSILDGERAGLWLARLP